MIAPNRHTVGLGALLSAAWYAGASQNNAAAYLLGFVVVSVAAVSAIHAWVNLHPVTLTAEPADPVFAGGELALVLNAHTPTTQTHTAIRVAAAGSSKQALFDPIELGVAQKARISVGCPQRGAYPDITVRLSTQYPLGFFTASRPVRLEQPYLVYPKPEGTLPLPPAVAASRQQGLAPRVAGDEFAGTRTYRAGESQRHIDWKAAARKEVLLSKQWAGDSENTLELDWQQLAHLSTEARLSQLARWVIVAENSGAAYGLKLPALTIPPGRQHAHFHRCLRALALFPHDRS